MKIQCKDKSPRILCLRRDITKVETTQAILPSLLVVESAHYPSESEARDVRHALIGAPDRALWRV
jgi:hypothetical protein